MPEGPIAEVISCVDLETALAWRTELFDHQHSLLRSITVEKTMRTEAGVTAAKMLTVTLPESSSKIDIYSGDEHYPITPDTFALLDAAVA